jgi:hypothetical protein
MRKDDQKKYNYKQFTILFDLDIEEEKKMVEWLNKHKGKRNGFSTQLKKALEQFIESQK